MRPRSTTIRASIVDTEPLVHRHRAPAEDEGRPHVLVDLAGAEESASLRAPPGRRPRRAGEAAAMADASMPAAAAAARWRSSRVMNPQRSVGRSAGAAAMRNARPSGSAQPRADATTIRSASKTPSMPASSRMRTTSRRDTPPGALVGSRVATPRGEALRPRHGAGRGRHPTQGVHRARRTCIRSWVGRLHAIELHGRVAVELVGEHGRRGGLRRGEE